MPADETAYARIHPDDWKQLDIRFDGIRTYTDVRTEGLEDRIDAVESSINGNGQPGIATRLARVETKVKVVWGGLAAAASIAAAAALSMFGYTPTK